MAPLLGENTEEILGECGYAPGAIRKLIDRWGLREPILDLAATGAPFLGTCAGMIVLSREIAGGDAPVLPLLDVTVARNAFGRQLDSFEADLAVPVLGDQPVHAIFIRAPVIERTGPGVDILAQLADGRVVAVRQRNVIATSFHPELTNDDRVHGLFLAMVRDLVGNRTGASDSAAVRSAR